MSLPMYQRRTNSRERGTNNTTSSGHFSNPNSGNNMSMYGRRSNSSNYDPEYGGVNTAETNASIMEQQNNDRIDELSDQVARLKGLTMDINSEVKEQNSLLDNMGDSFGNTRDALQGSLRRMQHMLESGGARHMCYMVGFVVFVMVFLYWLMTHKGTSGA
jgi:blocked-early-in-transport protein 1